MAACADVLWYRCMGSLRVLRFVVLLHAVILTPLTLWWELLTELIGGADLILFAHIQFTV
jgi:hypothetical protein